jgi:alkylhydroperoxidase family enzyme
MGQRPALLALAFAAWAATAGSIPAAAPPPAQRFDPLSNGEAWRMLPREDPPLPAWARVLAGSLPRTTAHMIHLDHVHRVKNPLGPELRGKLRWVVADTNRCEYARAYAEADLRRAGVEPGSIEALAGGWTGFSKAERAALAFARQATREASAITDEQMAALIRHYGEEKVVAIVHTVAYGNFQDRILLALGVAVEGGGPLPPMEIRIAPPDATKSLAPPRPPWKEVLSAKVKVPDVPPGWSSRGFDDIRRLLDNQKQRKPRIAMPPPERLAMMPPEARERTRKILWSNASMGYQPLLTKTWFDCMGQFGPEARLDPIFSGSMFWAVTRSIDCFY